jgi:superoxide dismutase, Fe-Mn family
MTHTLPEMPYAYDALEPYIDAQTMAIHHMGHHQTYVDKLNAALEGYGHLQRLNAQELVMQLDKLPEPVRTAARNHGGGHVNHSFFWPLLKRNVPFKGEVADAIVQTFGSREKFELDFLKAAAALFGSGWAWLVLDNGKMEIITTPNQDCPLSQHKTLILGLDVWEHAYYLKYQNRRPDYIDAFFHVINWEKVNEHFQQNNT